MYHSNFHIKIIMLISLIDLRGVLTVRPTPSMGCVLIDLGKDLEFKILEGGREAGKRPRGKRPRS